MIHAVETCVHCGFAWRRVRPTELGQKWTLRAVGSCHEGCLRANLRRRPAPHRPLSRLSACEPACPSGVPYRDLISPYRSVVRSQTHHSTGQRVRRALVRWTLPSPVRFRWAITAARLGRWLRPVLPSVFRPLLDLAPASVPAAQSWPSLVPALGPRRGRVALLTGCAQQVLAPDITPPPSPSSASRGSGRSCLAGCCGGLAWHTGDSTAQRYACRTLDAFPDDVDAIRPRLPAAVWRCTSTPLMLRGT
jgi:glycolate oxidase iron-sulfur subunit